MTGTRNIVAAAKAGRIHKQPRTMDTARRTATIVTAATSRGEGRNSLTQTMDMQIVIVTGGNGSAIVTIAATVGLVAITRDTTSRTMVGTEHQPTDMVAR